MRSRQEASTVSIPQRDAASLECDTFRRRIGWVGVVAGALSAQEGIQLRKEGVASHAS